jgi:hypothetical protein
MSLLTDSNQIQPVSVPSVKLKSLFELDKSSQPPAQERAATPEPEKNL